MSPGDHLWPLPGSAVAGRSPAIPEPHRGKHRKAGWLSAVLAAIKEAARRRER